MTTQRAQAKFIEALNEAFSGDEQPTDEQIREMLVPYYMGQNTENEGEFLTMETLIGIVLAWRYARKMLSEAKFS